MNDWLEAEQRVERAQQLSESQQWAEALEEIEAALAINPHNAAWHAHRGCLLEELDQCGDAVQAFEDSLEIDPGDPEVALALSVVLTRLGRFSRALEVLERLGKRHTDFEPAFCQRINVYAELGRHDRAEEMFYLAQELNDSCPHCFFHMGSSLSARGQFDRAIFCWQRVLELEPEYIGVNRRIAEAYRAQGRLEEAREYYIQEVRKDPGNTDLLCELAEMLFVSGHVGTAAAKFAQILELDPDHEEAHFALGGIWLIRGQPAQALKCFDAVTSLIDGSPDLPGFDGKVGEALFQLRRFAEAQVRLEAAVSQDAGDVDTLMLLADCQLAMGKASRAADTFRRILVVSPDNPWAHHKLAVCLCRQGRHEAGLEHCLAALRAKPDYLAAMRVAVSAHLDLAQWREARTMLRRALRNSPEDPVLRRVDKRLWYYRLRHGLRRLMQPFARAFGLSGS
jgi:tetratricopeptide (TPR) repeat protein